MSAATSDASSSSAAEDQSWTSKVDRPGNELPMFKQKIWRRTEQMVANESAASLPQAEGESSHGRMFICNWSTTTLKRTHNIWKTKLPEI